jgi:tRNA 2-thiouridine synthesizing protein A
MTGRAYRSGKESRAMELLEINANVDARGLSCPMPIVRTAQAMKSLASGAILEVLATDPGSIKDFAAWCRSTGNELVEQTSDGEVYRFVIRRK